MSDCTAILLAAGRSQRLGFDKILTPLCGQPVLLYSLQSLLSSPRITEILIVTREDIISSIEEIVARENSTKPVKVLAGGLERQDSVYEGLKAVSQSSSRVLIHDAARPLLSLAMIEKTLEASLKTGGAVAAKRATDTLKVVGNDGVINTTLDRSKVWLMETPQVFEKDLITRSYAKVIKEKSAVTDDASTVELGGGSVVVVESDTLNLKITRSTDWQILELWLKQADGKRVREEVHQLCNEFSPLVGYLPLLEKYGGRDEKFIDYLGKCRNSTGSLQDLLRSLQARVRDLFG
jgi:2-C-methyl-D-erythritol 4-phosphate cytidylyltransferase